jgi:hypothetical protein
VSELRLGRVKFQAVSDMRVYIAWIEDFTNCLYWERSMGNLESTPDMMVDVKDTTSTPK